MKLLSVALILFQFYFSCLSFPQCCPSQYNDEFFAMFKCGLSVCKSSERSAENPCISCILENTVNSQVLPKSLLTTIFSRPQKLCEDFNEIDSGRLVLSWSISPPSIYIIEARDRISQWTVMGMTNTTTVNITNIIPHLYYQFRVTSVLSANGSLMPATSDWIKLSGMSSALSAPSNISVSDFILKNGFLEATVKWNTSPELPCAYKLFWTSLTDPNNFEEKIIQLPKDNLSAVISDLVFDSKYSLTVVAEGSGRRSQPSSILFQTPDCLNLTAFNFNICIPGPPRNVTVQPTKEGAIIFWMPPAHASSSNAVSGYHVTLLKDGIECIYSTKVTKEYLNVNVSFTKFNKGEGFYLIEVVAVSEGGTSKPATSELHITDLSSMKFAAVKIPYHYVLPTIAAALFLAFSIIFKIYKTSSNIRATPSGLADVGDKLLPYLVTADKIQLQEVLGRGAFCVVHRAIYLRSKSKEEVAVKVFPSETNTRQKLLEEVEMLHLLGRHDRIVGLHGFTLHVDKMFLILEFCPLGNLHSYLVNLKPKLMHMKSLSNSQRTENISETCRLYGKQLCSYIFQVAQGMEYISSLKLIHRDMAARNILMQNVDRVKIADFGLSKDVYEKNVYCESSHTKLPIKWMALESLEKHKFTTYSDVWSFGVFMWEVFKLGKEPYPGLSNAKVLEYLCLGFRLEKPHCTQEWYDLMQKCWRENPRERPTFKALLERIAAIVDKMYLYTPLT